MYAENKLRKTPHYATSLGLNIKCRELKDAKLKTQIIDFDIAKGITYCQIYKKDNPDFILNINADAQWQLIRSSKFKEYDKATASTKIESMSSNIGKSTGNSSNGDTLSTFMVKTVLLMDNSGGSKGTNVTEYDATSFKDTWDNSSGAWETFANIADTVWENVKAPVKWVASKFGAETEVSKRELKVPYVVSASDGFTAENLAYYKALFNGINTVYIHLQNLLFIVVGGFFLATLGGGKIQKYLENRGQSTGNKEPYLHKFFIPLLCAGVFYMPIIR